MAIYNLQSPRRWLFKVITGYVYRTRRCRFTLVETLFTPCGDRHLNFCRYRPKHHIIGIVLVPQDCRGEIVGSRRTLPRYKVTYNQLPQFSDDGKNYHSLSSSGESVSQNSSPSVSTAYTRKSVNDCALGMSTNAIASDWPFVCSIS